MRYLYIALFAFSFFQSSNLISNDFFFYEDGKKRELVPDYKYLVVKFAAGVSSTESDNIISSNTGKYREKISEFAPATSNCRFQIIKLNNSAGENVIQQIKSALIKNDKIEYVGMCFPGRGKMKHYTTNEFIVKFKRYVSAFEVENANKIFKSKTIEKVQGFDNLYLLSIVSKGADGEDNVFDISNKYTLLSSLVEYAQPNFIREGMLLETGDHESPKPPLTNDSMASQMWHLKNTGNNIPDGVIGTPGCDLNIEQAWQTTTGNPNVLIAFVDTGVDTNHTDLKGTICARDLWFDGVDPNNHAYDLYYHGTGVTGTTSAMGNNVAGTVGIAYNCKFMPVRVFGPAPAGFTTDLILGKGLNWAWTHGASVINCSWGGGISTPLITNAIRDAVHFGRNGKGALVFAGSGNDNRDTILYPASLPESIGVGGLSPCNQRKNPHSCDFNGLDSNQFWGASYGDGLSVVAPCTFIGTTAYYGYMLGGWCICGNGTSCASPIAAGVGALMFSKNSNLSGDSARMIIEMSAKKVGNYNYSIPKVHGLWNFEMGYGRIDAKSALDMTPAGPQASNDLVPPIITIYPPESGLFSGTVSCKAIITDNNGIAGIPYAPRLYYHNIQNNQLQVINGVLNGSTYTFTFPRIPLSMSLYYYIAAQDIYGNTMTYPVGGKGNNPPGSYSPPRMMFLRNTSKYDTNYTAVDVPKTISAARETTVVSLLHNNNSRTVLDADCWININHTYDADLTICLISPSGTEVILAGGLGGNGQNYVNTYFDDEASISIDDTVNTPPFTGHFKPLDKLWTFDGENSGGDWTLKIVDNGPSDGGTLISWGMKLTYSAIPDYVMLPDKFSLVRNYPNPFNPRTRILFNVPYPANIKITLYDITGREVKTILNERRSAALEDFVDFDISDVSNVSGSGMASGVYFYTMVADGKFIESRKMVLIK